MVPVASVTKGRCGDHRAGTPSTGNLRSPVGPRRDRDDPLQALDRAREDAEEMLRVAGVIVPEYLEARSEFQNQVHSRALWSTS